MEQDLKIKKREPIPITKKVNLQEAIYYYKEARRLCRKDRKPISYAGYTIPSCNMIKVYCLLREYSKAIEIYEEIKDHIDKETANKHDLYSNIAEAKYYLNKEENNDDIEFEYKEKIKETVHIKKINKLEDYLREERDNNIKGDSDERTIEYKNQIKKLNSEIISSRDFYNRKIIIEYNLGSYEEALKDFQELLNIEKKEKIENIFDYQTLICIGKIYYFKEDFNNKSIYWFNEAKSINKNDWEVYYCLGACYYQSKDYQKAINNFKKSIDIDANKYNHNMLLECHKLNNTFEIFVAEKLLLSTRGVWEEINHANGCLAANGGGIYNTLEMYDIVKKYSRKLLEYLESK